MIYMYHIHSCISAGKNTKAKAVAPPLRLSTASGRHRLYIIIKSMVFVFREYSGSVQRLLTAQCH